MNFDARLFSKLLNARFLKLASVILWGIAGILTLNTYPKFKKAIFTLPGKAPEEKIWPFLNTEAKSGFLQVEIPFHLGAIHPTKFAFFGEGRLTSLKVNGVPVGEENLPRVLEQFNGVEIDLSSHLRSGENTLSAEVETIGTVALRPYVSITDPLQLSLLALLSAALAGTSAWAVVRFSIPAELGGIFVLGSALRIFYGMGSPYHVRFYDLAGHVEYIRYIAEHLSIPAPGYGWETHQAPLYYILCGLWKRVLGGEESSLLFGQWQIFSLFLSILSLAICIPIARILFSDRKSAAYLLGIAAVFPGLVFVSNRVSNDALFAALSFVWFLTLLRFWKKPTLWRWLAVSVALGVGMIAKNTTLVLIAVSFVCLLVKAGFSLRQKGIACAVLAASLLLLTGWYQMPRILSAKDATGFIAANMTQTDKGLYITRSVANLLTFNPVKVMELPFASSRDDKYRRAYMPEYFYKSAFFGEWVYGNHLLLAARTIMLLGMLLLLFGAWGLFNAIKERDFWLMPVVVSALGMVGAAWALVWVHTLSSNQDFRYQVLLLLPIAYFVVRGARGGGVWGLLTLSAFVLNSLMFLVLLVSF